MTAMKLYAFIAGLEAEGWRIISCTDHSVLVERRGRRMRLAP